MPDFFSTRTNKALARGIKKSKKQPRWKKPVLIAVIILLVLGGASASAAAVYVPKVKDAVSHAQLAKQALEESKVYLLAQDFDKGKAKLAESENHLQAVGTTVEALSWAEFIPYLRLQYQAADSLLTGSSYLFDALYQLVDVAQSVLTPLQNTDAKTFESISEDDKEAILSALYASQVQFEEIQETFAEANASFEQIPEKGLIRQLDEAIQPIREQIPSINETIDSLVPLSRALPQFLGYPEQQKYLLLFQNNTELRPTGGFVGTYGIVKIKNADIISLESDNVYNLDEPAKENGLSIEPPGPLFQYNGVTQWFLRDSNWSPDFPTSAKKALEFYYLEDGPERNLDGVIALDPTFIVSLLDITGPITVRGTEFTSENFVAKLQEHVSQGFKWQGLDTSARKDIIGELGEALMAQLYELPKPRWQEIFIALEKNLSRKHFLLWSENDPMQSILESQGWAGSIQQNTDINDLIFIDANLASLKTDPAVDRSTHATISEQKNGSFQVHVSRTYTNKGKLNWKTTRYRTYTRLYVPEGSQLITSSGAMVDCKIENGPVDTSTELSHTVYSFFICIEPGEEKTVQITYQLPDRFSRKTLGDLFPISLIKQAGTPGDSITIELVSQKAIREVPKGVDKIEQFNNTHVLLEDVLIKDTTYTFGF